MWVRAVCVCVCVCVCAEHLARARGRPVSWRTIGSVGADTQELRALLETQVEQLQAVPLEDIHLSASPQASSSSGSFGFDVAVVLCGVNDGEKILSEMRLPSAFREDLGDLCAALRRHEPDGRIVVPCFPNLVAAPILQRWPMNYVVGFFLRRFEAQKEMVAETQEMYTHDCVDIRSMHGSLYMPICTQVRTNTACKAGRQAFQFVCRPLYLQAHAHVFLEHLRRKA